MWLYLGKLICSKFFTFRDIFIGCKNLIYIYNNNNNNNNKINVIILSIRN
ncbi:hypothetical protein ACMBCN_00695 [Candidatus Liberibacter asiaticus]